jgi:hypothetical protein
MRKLLLTALAMLPLAAPVTAFATTWYVLNYGTNKCETSAAIVHRSGIAAFASPGALEAALRVTALFKEKHVYRDNSGQVTGVTIINSSDIAMAYFPDLKHCQIALAAGIEQGQVAEPRGQTILRPTIDIAAESKLAFPLPHRRGQVTMVKRQKLEGAAGVLEFKGRTADDPEFASWLAEHRAHKGGKIRISQGGTGVRVMFTRESDMVLWKRRSEKAAKATS